MTALNRKLLRDIAHMATQAIAISLVMGCGVAMLVMSLCTYRSMLRTRDRYYERYRFAEVFAHLKRAPNPLAERIAEIPGVARVQTRVVAEVTLDLPGMAEPVSGRFVSIPEYPTRMLNQLHIRSGRYIAPRAKSEVLVDEAFAQAHRLAPGSQVRAVLNGKLERLTIVGIALSPEYVYAIQPGQLFPDNKRFGVFWMGDEELAAAFGLRDAFNSVALTLMHGASEPEVLQRLDHLTEPYGGTGAYGRADQVSHRFVSDELIQLRGMAAIVPVIFFVVAAFLLNVVLNRLDQHPARTNRGAEGVRLHPARDRLAFSEVRAAHRRARRRHRRRPRGLARSWPNADVYALLSFPGLRLFPRSDGAGARGRDRPRGRISRCLRRGAAGDETAAGRSDAAGSAGRLSRDDQRMARLAEILLTDGAHDSAPGGTPARARRVLGPRASRFPSRS